MIDTRNMDADYTSMSNRTKRTYNLSSEAVTRVREMVGQDDLPGSQDGIVELAIDHLYRHVSDRADAARWASAGSDNAFLDEMRSLAVDVAAAETRVHG